MRTHKLIFHSIGLVAMLCVSSSILASNSNQLKKLSHKIASVKAVLTKEQSKREQLQLALEKTELAYGVLQKQYQYSQKQIKKQKKILTSLKIKKNQLDQSLQKQQNILEKQIRTAYMLGRQPYIKLVLNQQNANEVNRILTYYRYISQKRVDAIKSLQNTLFNIKINQKQLQAQLITLSNLQQQQQQQNKKLGRIKRERVSLIYKLSASIKTKRQQLEQLLSNKKRLEATVARLERQTQTQRLAAQHFSKRKGRLPWPTKGKIVHLFGTKIKQSELTWSGDLIRGRLGQPVYAIAAGKVIFSRWLPGYGLLLIINHGNGYMSLYGRNHSTYKKVGDWVVKGEVIASVGRSGGYKKPALYFAIRHNVKPLNPILWCKRR